MRFRISFEMVTKEKMVDLSVFGLKDGHDCDLKGVVVAGSQKVELVATPKKMPKRDKSGKFLRRFTHG